MRLTLEIRASERNPYYIVYNDRDYRFSDIIGCGWTIIDAVNQFLAFMTSIWLACLLIVLLRL